MALNNCTLGEHIELRAVTNDDLLYGVEDVRGVNNLKMLMPTKADINGRDLSKFQIVYPSEFVFNHRTSRNGSKFSIAYNDGDRPVICTEDHVLFRIKEESKNVILPEWLYMFFNRVEFDRYVITNSWGISTEFYNWEDICSVELNLPPLPVQKKYVAIYKAMVANQQSYERGLEDLKLVCDGYIENLRRRMPSEKIGPYLTVSDKRNAIGLSVDSVRGISTNKELIPTKADMNGVGLDNYKTVEPGQITYVADTSRRGDKISLGHNDTQNTFLVSSIYTVFGTSIDRLIPEYLMLFLTREEFNRYARFHSWGSARETFDWDEMRDVEIPIPDIKVQKAVAEVFAVYNARKRISEQLKAQIKDICPILIKDNLSFRLSDSGLIELQAEHEVLSPEIITNIDLITEPGIHDLLKEAIEKHMQPTVQVHRDAVEKIWDALERLKTYYATMDKRTSASKIVCDMAAGDQNYIALFNAEFKTLTDIGNDYRIRHHETNKIEIADPRYYDYFFNRCLSLIALAIQYLQ